MSKEKNKYIDFLVRTMGKQSTAILYKHIAEYENKDEKEIKKEYKGIDAWIAEKVFGEIDDKNARLKKFKELKEKVKEEEKEVGIIHEKFKDIKFGFRSKKGEKQSAEDKLRQWCKKSFLKNEADYSTEELLKKCQEKKKLFTFEQFYDWYREQNKECCYCKTSAQDLKKLFKIKDSEDEQNKPLYSKKPSFSAELQIEKIEPNRPYNKANCSLACAFCNNAKSDMVNQENFEAYFKNTITKFMKDLLGGKSNEMSPF